MAWWWFKDDKDETAQGATTGLWLLFSHNCPDLLKNREWMDIEVVNGKYRKPVLRRTPDAHKDAQELWHVLTDRMNLHYFSGVVQAGVRSGSLTGEYKVKNDI
jgi:hypothetical protein